MKVAIFDLQHFEMIHVLLQVLSGKENTISLFTNSTIATKIEALEESFQFDIINLDKFKSSHEFYKKCGDFIISNDIDIVIFNTIDREYHLVWKLIKKIPSKVFITIHNINTWLNPPFTLNKIALKNYYFRTRMLKKSEGIIVTEDLFINFIKQRKLYKKKVLVLPFTLNTKNYHHTPNKQLRVAIPGTIDGNNRRNYQLAISAIEKIHEIDDSIQFVFLGPVIAKEGQEVFSKISNLIGKGVNIEHKFDTQSNKIFENEMIKCDVVFMPVVVNYKYEGINEKYGQTKVSGVLYDMMRFQKPGIIPAEHIAPPTMQTSIITYNSEADFIEKLIALNKNRTTLEKYLKCAEDNSIYYSTGNVKERFLPKLFESVNQ